MPTWDPSDVFRIVDVTGVVANGLLGGVVARSRRFDLIGFFALAIVSALGGGMLRDVMLASAGGFPVALTDPAYLSAALLAAGLAFVINFDGKWTHRMIIAADLLTLGCWSATGALKAAGLGLGTTPAILLGVTTAVGGGIIRDVVIGERPRIFGGNPLYATVAIAGSVIALVGRYLGTPELGMGMSILVCAAFGLAARRFGWVLPEPVTLSLRIPKAPLRRIIRGRQLRRRRHH